jgi:RNA polymerase sigma factor (sigma-70 family)
MDRRVQAASRNRDLKSEQMIDLVALAQKGDQDAFRTLYDEYVGQIYALCLRFTADPVKAEDRTQSAFIRAWEKLHTYRGEGGFIQWLKKLTTNLIFQEQRADKRRSLRLLVTDDPAAYEKPTPALPESKIDLERAIALLPDGARTVLVLHDIEGYKHNEIADLTGIAPGTSKAQLHRARKLLREMLER